MGRARALDYQLTQRADFFETEVGLETTLKRPIINTRDEPHADPEKYRRLHVIVGDANMCEVATFLKIGTTAIVLKMIEDHFLPDLSIVNPVQALHEVSRDVTCTREVTLTDGRQVSAVQLQWEYLEHAKKYVEREDDTPENREVRRALGVRARRARDPTRSRCTASSTGSRSTACSRPTATGTGSNGPTRSSGPSTCSTTTCAATRACTTGWKPSGKVERLTSDDEVERAVMEPPEDTRAYFRGRCISKYPDAIAAASWDSLIVDTGADALQRIPMREPLRGTKAARRRPAGASGHRRCSSSNSSSPEPVLAERRQ